MIKKKCLLLLPTAFNDGEPIPLELLQDVIRLIDETLDCSVGGRCEGVYQMDNGGRIRDRSVMAWAVVEPEQVDDLRKLAARIAGMLKQETIYFEVSDVEFDLIRPDQSR